MAGEYAGLRAQWCGRRWPGVLLATEKRWEGQVAGEVLRALPLVQPYLQSRGNPGAS